MQRFTPSRIARWLTTGSLVLALASASVQAADESGDVIRASADEVRIAFAATDRDGHTIKTLRSTDVAVGDNGLIIRQFRSFRPAMPSPLDLVLLLDTSASVESYLPRQIAEAESFIENSTWGERDRVSIIAFGGMRPQVLCTRNCRAAAARGQLNALRAGGDTPLYDALLLASDILNENRDPESRPAMVLFSDGLDSISIHDMSDVVEASQNLQAAIYSINSRSSKSAPSNGDAVLDYLASSTGGLSFAPGQNVKEVLRTVVEDLHSGYVLTYVLPAHPAGRHSLRILPTSDPRLQFRARSEYNDSGDE